MRCRGSIAGVAASVYMCMCLSERFAPPGPPPSPLLQRPTVKVWRRPWKPSRYRYVAAARGDTASPHQRGTGHNCATARCLRGCAAPCPSAPPPAPRHTLQRVLRYTEEQTRRRQQGQRRAHLRTVAPCAPVVGRLGDDPPPPTFSGGSGVAVDGSVCWHGGTPPHLFPCDLVTGKSRRRHSRGAQSTPAPAWSRLAVPVRVPRWAASHPQTRCNQKGGFDAPDLPPAARRDRHAALKGERGGGVERGGGEKRAGDRWCVGASGRWPGSPPWRLSHQRKGARRRRYVHHPLGRVTLG